MPDVGMVRMALLDSERIISWFLLPWLDVYIIRVPDGEKLADTSVPNTLKLCWIWPLVLAMMICPPDKYTSFDPSGLRRGLVA